MQMKKHASSPPVSASISCQPQPSLSQSPPTPQTTPPTNPKAASFPRSSISINDRMSYLATPSFSVSTNDRASPTSNQTNRCPTPTSCQARASPKSTSHISSSRRSPSRPDAIPISLLAVKPTTNTRVHSSTINCQPHPVAVLPSRPASSLPTPCSSVVTAVRRPLPAQSQHSTASSARKAAFSPSRATISWTERPSTAESPGPSSRAVSSASISSQSTDPPPRSYCHLMVTPRTVTVSCKSQSRSADQHRRRIPTVVAASASQPEPAPSSTHCSQAITGPISSPVVHRASHGEASAQTTEIIRSYDSSFAARNSWSRAANSLTSQQQQPSSGGAPSRDSSST